MMRAEEVVVVPTPDSSRRPLPRRPAPDGAPRHVDTPRPRWTSWPVLVPRVAAAGLAVALAVGTLIASAAVPASTSAAKSRPAKPAYLQPVGELVHNHFLPGPLFAGDVGTVGVPKNAPPVPKTVDPKVAAQEAPVIAQFGGAAGTLTPAAIATLALQRGCSPSEAVIATAVAMAESGGSPSAQGDIGLMTPVWDWSAGLWQIRGLRAQRGTGALRDSVANQEVTHNAAAMYAIAQGCTNWTPWSTYNTGAYRPYLSLAQRAVEYVIGYAGAHAGNYPAVPAPDPNATVPTQSSGGGGVPAAAPAGARPARSSTAAKSRTSAAAPARPSSVAPARTAAAAPPPETSSAAPTTPPGAPLPTKPTIVPLPTLKLPLPSTTLPLPLPTLKLPLPTLTLPKLP